MAAFLLSVFRLVRLLMSGQGAIAMENAALRLQLAAFRRKRKRPVLRTLDRLFWVGLSRVWHWLAWSAGSTYSPTPSCGGSANGSADSGPGCPNRRAARRGRPATATEIRRLIEQMAAANPLWRAPRIHGELKMLGIAVSERTVSRILRTLRRPPTQTWKTFLHNHLGQLVSIDFFTVPTVTMKVLFVFIVLEHHRRQVLHFNVTEHPTAAWTSQQIVEAFADRDAPDI